MGEIEVSSMIADVDLELNGKPTPLYLAAFIEDPQKKGQYKFRRFVGQPFEGSVDVRDGKPNVRRKMEMNFFWPTFLDHYYAEAELPGAVKAAMGYEAMMDPAASACVGIGKWNGRTSIEFNIFSQLVWIRYQEAINKVDVKG
ncbi:MAG: hypothetical protein HY362_03660 [Candidatus Aenigmarchaeota archaeon]|nr:hypothetical protein [Candidatus Aenigmarchaeota archaeon]